MIGALLRRFGKPPVYVVRPWASPGAYLASRQSANFRVELSPTAPECEKPAVAGGGDGGLNADARGGSGASDRVTGGESPGSPR